MSLEQLEQQILMAEKALQKATQSDDKRLKDEIRAELTNFTKVLERSRSRLKELEFLKKQADDLSAQKESRMKEIESQSSSESPVQVEISDPSEKEPYYLDVKLKLKPKTKPLSFDMPWFSFPALLPKLPALKAAEPKAIEPQEAEPKESEPKESEPKEPEPTKEPEPKADKPQEPEPQEDGNDRFEGDLVGMALSFGSQVMRGANDMASISTLGSQIYGTSEITRAIMKEMQCNAPKPEPEEEEEEERNFQERI